MNDIMIHVEDSFAKAAVGCVGWVRRLVFLVVLNIRMIAITAPICFCWVIFVGCVGRNRVSLPCSLF